MKIGNNGNLFGVNSKDITSADEAVLPTIQVTLSDYFKKMSKVGLVGPQRRTRSLNKLFIQDHNKSMQPCDQTTAKVRNINLNHI